MMDGDKRRGVNGGREVTVMNDVSIDSTFFDASA